MDKREKATILAALRFWQRKGLVAQIKSPVDDIATDGGTLSLMQPKEIDALCERINKPAPSTFASIQAVIDAYDNALDVHIWTKDDKANDPDAFAADEKLVADAKAELLNHRPRVAISISGGAFQGAQATIPMDLEIHDEDNLEAEGKSDEERNAAWESLTEGMVPIA